MIPLPAILGCGAKLYIISNTVNVYNLNSNTVKPAFKGHLNIPEKVSYSDRCLFIESFLTWATLGISLIQCLLITWCPLIGVSHEDGVLLYIVLVFSEQVKDISDVLQGHIDKKQFLHASDLLLKSGKYLHASLPCAAIRNAWLMMILYASH